MIRNPTPTCARTSRRADQTRSHGPRAGGEERGDAPYINFAAVVTHGLDHRGEPSGGSAGRTSTPTIGDALVASERTGNGAARNFEGGEEQSAARAAVVQLSTPRLPLPAANVAPHGRTARPLEKPAQIAQRTLRPLVAMAPLGSPAPYRQVGVGRMAASDRGALKTPPPAREWAATRRWCPNRTSDDVA